MSKEAMKLALEALENAQANVGEWWPEAIAALREALTSGTDWASEAKEQPAQPQISAGPVTPEMMQWTQKERDELTAVLKTHLKPEQRKPLTDDEIAKEVEAELTHYWNGEYIDTTGARDQLAAFARAIEAKLKEKNA